MNQTELALRFLERLIPPDPETKAPWEGGPPRPLPDWVTALLMDWKSDNIADLAGALAVAQSKMPNAPKDSANPHFKSTYADLAAVWDSCRPYLGPQGISVIQRLLTCAHTNTCYIHTVLMHNTGQWVSSLTETECKDKNVQTLGSAATYLRRYSLSAMAGVAPDDDDGESTAAPAAEPTAAADETDCASW